MSAPHANRRLVGCLLALGLVAGWLDVATAHAQQGSQTAVDIGFSPSGPIGIGEVVRLEITVHLGSANNTSVPRFELDNFEVVSGPSQTTSLRIVNGRTSHSRTFLWLLRAKAVGSARVHGGTVTVGTETVRIAERGTDVVAEAPPRQRRRASADPFDRILGRPSDRDDPFDRFLDRRRRRPEPRAPEIFLRAEASPRRPVVGQQVLYTLYLYTDVNVRSVAPTELPDFKGFWTTVIPQADGEVQPERVTHDGREIGRVVLLQRALFPRRAGRLEIEPVQAEMRALLGDTSPFGSILPRMGEITRSSNTVAVDVQPLPEPAPNGFQGAVGGLQIDAALEPRELEVGEAATLTVRLHGSGHLQGVPAPTLPAVDGLEIFPPQQLSDQALRGTRVVGDRSWSFVLVPQRPGRIVLPPIETVSFDPRRGDYQTLSTAELALEVRGATSMARDGGGTAELHSIRETVVPLDTGAGLSWPIRHLLFGLPLLVACGLLVARRRRGGDGHGARGARQRLLRGLDAAAGESRAREVAAAIESAWRRFLDERWSIAPGTPSTLWRRRLEAAGARADAAEELVRLADDVHYLRYAPKLSSTDELQRELLERSRRLAKALR